MNTVIEAFGPFWFAVFSVLAIGGPLAVFTIAFAIAKWLSYSTVGVILTVLLTLLGLAPALAFMFTQWAISGTWEGMSLILFPPAVWAGIGIIALWVGGGLFLATLINDAKK